MASGRTDGAVRGGRYLVWTVGLTLAALAVPALAQLCGGSAAYFGPGGNGRNWVQLTAVLTLWVLIGREQENPSRFGLVVDDHWLGVTRNGLLIGFAAALGLYLWSWWVGALVHNAWSSTSWLTIAINALTALVTAFSLEFLFRGFAFTVLRDLAGRTVAVLVSALAFALLARLDQPLAAFQPANVPGLVGLFLAGVLLGVLRLRTGGILFGASLVGGWLYVDKAVTRFDLLLPQAHSAWAAWLCPGRDLLAGPPAWGVLTLLSAAVWVTTRTKGVISPSAAVSVEFKRVMPFSNLGMLAPLDVWVRLLWRARFAVGPRYLPRLIVILAVSAVNTLLALPERLIVPWLVRRRRVPDPVFILGVHRSGTTHLHNLLALDPRFVSPRTYQAMNPTGFLLSGWLITTVVSLFVPRKRAMDNVRFSLFTTWEEEYAVAHSSVLSPAWGATFPREYPAFDRYLFPRDFTPAELTAWKRSYVLFLRKIGLLSRKAPLLKNPYNTGRVGLLADLFPGGRFIHIIRHPFAVTRSNNHLARESHCLFQVQDPDDSNSYDVRFPDNYRAMEDAFAAQAAVLDPGRVVEVRFEDLERDPIGEIGRMYRQLGLEMTPTFRRRLDRYLAGIADYQKNQFKPFPFATRLALYEKLRPMFERGGYNADLDAPAKAA